jgi:hypothetical protein
MAIEAHHMAVPRTSEVRIVEEVEELNALVLDRAVELDVVILIDRYGNPLSAYPDRRAERVHIVRQPLLAEASQIVDGVRTEVIEEWEPLTFWADELEQWRFPMTVAHTRRAPLIPTNQETDLAA